MHHTKTKGDIGVAHTIARLTELGWNVAIPITEHAPYDLIAEIGGRMLRIQVKYREAKNGLLNVRLHSNWSDKHGLHRSVRQAGDYDVLAVYSPGIGVLFLPEVLLGTTTVNIRTAPTKNGQVKRIRNAEEFKLLL